MKKALIIIPTYNEKENIEKIIRRIFSVDVTGLDSEIHILVVDDTSPDGTGDIVKKLQSENDRLHLVTRPEKQGLGKAYLAGFRYAIDHAFDYIFEMDADFSHDPNEIPNFLEKIQDCDVVLGSRYIKGVNVVNWPLSRLLLSYFANVYTRLITGMPIRDATGGYKCFRLSALKSLNLDKISSDGYVFQIEISFRAWARGLKICEIPIIFVDRVEGVSKMSAGIIHEATLMVWKLKLKQVFGKL